MSVKLILLAVTESWTLESDRQSIEVAQHARSRQEVASVVDSTLYDTASMFKFSPKRFG